MLAQADRASAGKRKAWVEQAQAICKEWYAKYKPVLESDAAADPARAHLRASSPSHVPDDAIVVVDTGHAGMWMGGMYDLKSPNQSYMRSAGHLGWAFPAGLGAKCGAPERPVVTFTGDAGLLVPHRRGRDRGALEDQRGDGRQQQRQRQPDASAASIVSTAAQQTEQARELWTFNKVNFARIAEDMGALGIRVEQASGLQAGARAGARRQSSGGHRRRHRHRRAGAACGELAQESYSCRFCRTAAMAVRRRSPEIGFASTGAFGTRCLMRSSVAGSL